VLPTAVANPPPLRGASRVFEHTIVPAGGKMTQIPCARGAHGIHVAYARYAADATASPMKIE